MIRQGIRSSISLPKAVAILRDSSFLENEEDRIFFLPFMTLISLPSLATLVTLVVKVQETDFSALSIIAQLF